MLSALLLFLILSGLCHALTRWGRVPAAVAPAAVVGLICGLLFVADFVALLRPASFSLASFGLGAAALGLTTVWQKRGQRLLVPDGSPGRLLWVAVTVLFFVLYAINRPKMFHDWDEFSHWGTVIRTIFGANTFHFDPNPLYFQDYPPGTALFAYFVLSVLGYSEGGAYFAYALILLAHCIPLWDLARRQGPLALALAIVSALMLVRVLGHGWASVLIDHILSVCFAGLVAGYLVIREDDAPRWSLALLFISLVLAKHAGTSLALVACGVMMVDAFVIAVTVPRRPGQDGPQWVVLAGTVGSWLLLLLPALVLSALWSHYVDAAGLARGYGRFGIGELFGRGLECCVSERERTILARYLDHWLGLPDALSLPVPEAQSVLGDYLGSRLGHLADIAGYSPLLLTLGLVAIGLVAVFCAPAGPARWRQGAALAALGGASLLFAVVQLLFYLYAFSDYEALAIASFKRFQNTYTLAWALSALAWLAIARRETRLLSGADRRPRWRRGGGWGLIVLALLVGGGALGGGSISDAQREQRLAMRAWIAGLPLPQGNGGRVYIVWQGSNGFEFWETHHEVLPRVTNRDCYSLGVPHFANDIWSCAWDETRLRTEWAGYDYVLVARGYADLRRNYPGLVPDLGPAADRELLRIDRNGTALRLSRLL